MMDLILIRPIWLLALIPAGLLWWALRRGQDSLDAWKKTFDPVLLRHLLVAGGGRRWMRPVDLLGLVWVAAVIALAGPSWREEPSPFARDDAGLMIVLRVAGTMNATDVQPSRLDRAKHKLRDLVDRREGMSTGLIVYSGSAHLVMPLTRDGRVIVAMAEDLEPGLMPIDGDRLDQALALAQVQLERASIPGSVVVMADSVAPVDVRPQIEFPTQFLAVSASTSPLDPGLENAAGSLQAPVVRMTVDERDVDQLAARAETKFRSASLEDTAASRTDGGYLLIPLIALGTLAWSRRGWVVQ